jgi:hypothetical protein
MTEHYAKGSIKFKFVGTHDEVSDRVAKVRKLIESLESMAQPSVGNAVVSEISPITEKREYKA